MSIFKYYKRLIRSIDSFFNPIDSQLKDNVDEVTEKNKGLYGFDALDNFPLKKITEHHHNWIYNDEDEE